MKCDDFHTLLDNFLDQDLSQAMLNEMQKHKDGCEICAMNMEELVKLRDSLSKLPAEVITQQFSEQVFAKTRNVNRHQTSRSWLPASLGGAIAAGLMTWFVITSPVDSTNIDSAVESIQLVVNQPESVRLAFNVPVAMQAVTVSLELPDHMEIEGFPGQHNIVWQTDLSRGQNVLKLPVIATQAREGELIAILTLANKNKVFRITTQASMPDQSVIEFGKLT